MAGDWIKLEHATLDKPEILELSELLTISHGDALLLCLRLWVWADQQSRDGHAIRVTKNGLDALMRCPGFSNALAHIGWLSGTDGNITFTNFDRHNGETSKKRGLATKRKQIERSGGHDDVTPMSRNERDKSATREEKRRDNNKGATAFAVPEWISKEDWQAFEESRRKLRKPMSDRARSLVLTELANLRDAGQDPSAVLLQSVRKGWQDVFPVKASTVVSFDYTAGAK